MTKKQDRKAAEEQHASELAELEAERATDPALYMSDNQDVGRITDPAEAHAAANEERALRPSQKPETAAPFERTIAESLAGDAAARRTAEIIQNAINADPVADPAASDASFNLDRAAHQQLTPHTPDPRSVDTTGATDPAVLPDGTTPQPAMTEAQAAAELASLPAPVSAPEPTLSPLEMAVAGGTPDPHKSLTESDTGLTDDERAKMRQATANFLDDNDTSRFTVGHPVQMKSNPSERATVAGIEGGGVLTLNFSDGTSGVGHASNWEPVPGLVQFKGEAVISMGSSLGGTAGDAPSDTSADAGLSFIDPAPESEGALSPESRELLDRGIADVKAGRVSQLKTDEHDAETLAEHSLDTASEIRAGIAHALLCIQQYQHAHYSTDFVVVERLLNEALPWINNHVTAENAKLAEVLEKVKSGEWTATAEILPVGQAQS